MKHPLIEKIHEECPNETHCTHDEEKCCYLNHEQKCIIKQNKIKGDTIP